jgi:hypothetical protein
MSPTPASRRSFATRTFNDNINEGRALEKWFEYTGPTTWTSTHRPYATINGSFAEDYDEWSLHGRPSSVTRSDLGHLEDVFDVSESRAAIFEPTTNGAVDLHVISAEVTPEYYDPVSLEQPSVELEEDWRIVHEDYASGRLERIGEDAQMDY